MKYVRSALAAFVLAVPAFAADGDDPAPQPAPVPAPAPGGDAKPEAKSQDKPAAKKERKVDPAATAALKKHESLVHLPSASGLKSINGSGGLEQMGMSIGLNPSWSAEKGFDLDVVLPDQIKEMMAQQGQSEEDAVKTTKSQLQMFFGLNAAFEAPGKDWGHYDVSFTQSGDEQTVELSAFDDEATSDTRSYTFGKDGLLKSSSSTPKVDPENPQSAMMAGMTFDVAWAFEKRGEKSVLTTRTLSFMGQEIAASFGYYDGPGGTYLVRDVTVSTPQGDQVIAFHDYTVDGKFVEATKAAPAAPAEKPKAEDKPAGEPPAPPAPPAPKDEPK